MKKIFSLTIVSLLASVGLSVAGLSSAHAVTGADWRAGNIISDSLFYDSNSMSVDDIQNFLNNKVPNCDTWGTQPASEKGYPGMTHKQYAAMAGWPGPPYICLKDYYQVPRSDTIINNYNSTASRPAGSISAAQIIKNAADNYGVSPKALLVLLHKESAGPLTVDSWPLESQYKNSMGYACPDTAPCDPQFAGFYNQVTNAAKRIQTYKNYPTSYRHQPFQTNSQVYYNPNLNGCRWSAVYIEGYATAGLYNYTPYQPNQAALNNLYGTGDGCSAYGNRNFWRLWNDWFGPTNLQFTKLTDPRWMELKSPAQKVDTQTGKPVGDVLPPGMQRQYLTKITLPDGRPCLRTSTDTNANNLLCIPLQYLKEITPVYTPLPDNTYMQMKSPTSKLDVLRRTTSSETYEFARQIRMGATTKVGGMEFYVSSHDYSNGIARGIPASDLEASVKYESIDNGRWFKLKNGTSKINPANGSSMGNTLPSGMVRNYSSRTYQNNQWYYRTEVDTSHNLGKAVPESELTFRDYSNFLIPRWMQLSRDTTQFSPSGKTALGETFQKGSQYKLVSKITVDGKTYFRTDQSTDQNVDVAFLASDLEEINFSSFVVPRRLTLNTDSPKINPTTEEKSSYTFTRGLTRQFNSKIYVNGKWFYRTEVDTVNGEPTAFEASKLSEVK